MLSTFQLNAQVDAADRDVLLRFAQISLDNPDDWGEDFNWFQEDLPVTEWVGVTVENNRVTGLELWMPRGIVPDIIGELSELKTLVLYGELYGMIPDKIGDLKKLETLSIYREFNDDENGLDGSLPESIGNLESLKQLDLSGNMLSGELPSNIRNLTNLEEISLYGNDFSGSIEVLTHLTKLRSIDLQFNHFSGPLPPSIANLVNLESLNLGANKFAGSLEPLKDLSKLEILDVSNNRFSGAIPENICNIPNLNSLYLHNNELTFDGMECIGVKATQAGVGTVVHYQDQANIPTTNNNPKLSVSAGGNLSNNTYVWFKDGAEYIAVAHDSTLTLSEPGTYYVQIYNSNAPDLILSSEAVEITVVESEGTLPLDFVDVKATACADGSCIQWKTTNEQNTSHFEVEVSTDGTSFKKIGGNVNSLNTTGTHNYNAVDNNTSTGINYYRIKQVDKDGAFKYSKTVSVTISASGVIFAAPNPSSGSFVLKGLNKAEKVSVYNLSGQLVKQWQNVIGNRQLNISNLSNGMYIIKVDQQGKQTLLRLLKH